MAATVPSIDRVREVLNYDPESGVLSWRVRRGPVKPGDIAGCIGSWGYRLIRVDGTLAGAHRIAWLHFHGEWPSRDWDIDHINGERDDNRIANLRRVRRDLNNWNVVKPPRHSTTGVLGVSFDKRSGRWEAHITLANRKRFLGYYGTSEEASAAYWKAKAQLHGIDAYGERLERLHLAPSSKPI